MQAQQLRRRIIDQEVKYEPGKFKELDIERAVAITRLGELPVDLALFYFLGGCVEICGVAKTFDFLKAVLSVQEISSPATSDQVSRWYHESPAQ